MIQPLFVPSSFSLTMLELTLTFLLLLEHVKLILISRHSWVPIWNATLLILSVSFLTLTHQLKYQLVGGALPDHLN